MKVKGITIELSADASGIESALKSVNRELGATQKELSSVNKSLKLDPGNADLIEQKQRLLAKAAGEAAEKLQALKQAQSGIDTNSASGQSQYDALTREISDTQVHLNQLNAEQRAFRASAGQASEGASAFGSALQNFSNGAANVAEKTRAISAAATVALGALTALAVKAGQQADDWLTLSQQIGVSTNTIQKFQYASSLIDVDMSTITGAFQKMTNTIRTSESSFEQIGVHVRSQNNELRSTEAIFFDVLQALSQISNETDRDTQAMNIFGRSASELAGLIDDGGKKLRELGNEAEDIGAIVSEEDLQTMSAFNDKLDTIKAQIAAAFMQFALPVMEALGPVIQKVADAVKGLADWFSGLSPTVMKVVSIFLALIAIISPVATILSKIGLAMMGLTQVVPAVIAGIQAIGQAFSALASNPYVIVIAAIVAALALLGFAIYECVQNWDSISDSTSSAMSSMKSSVMSGANAVKEFINSGFEKMTGIPNILDQVGEAFQNLVEKVGQVVTKVAAAFDKLSQKAKKAGSDILQKFVEGVDSVIGAVTGAFQKLADSIQNVWNSLTNSASSAGSKTAQAYIDSYNSNTGYIKQPTMLTNSYASGGGRYSTSATPSNSTGALVNAMNSLTSALNANNGTNVNVELVGSAKNIFDTVRVQNSIMTTATGYHALA